jgi:hypothetical protein
VIDFGMSPVEAVTVPRIHCEGKGIHGRGDGSRARSSRSCARWATRSCTARTASSP